MHQTSPLGVAPTRSLPPFSPNNTALGALEQKREAAARRRRKKRRIGLVLAALVAAGVGYGCWTWLQAQQPKVVTFAPEERWVMDSELYSFAMPTTPQEETDVQQVNGVQINAIDWRIESGDDLLLDVMVMSFPSDVGFSAPGGVDGVIDGMAGRSGGTVTADQTFYEGDVERRTVVIEIKGGRIFVDGFSKAGVVLLVSGGVPFENDDPPDTYKGIVDSVVLK